jgi:cytochrome P450
MSAGIRVTWWRVAVVVKTGVRGLCVNDIIKETLRLYPPTRYVYRRFTENGEDVKADIES